MHPKWTDSRKLRACYGPVMAIKRPPLKAGIIPLAALAIVILVAAFTRSPRESAVSQVIDPRNHRIRFSTVATQPDANTYRLNDSCPLYNVEFIGVGGVWEGSPWLAHSKMDHELKWLRTLDPEDLAVLVDGGDALCLPCDRDIRDEFFLSGYDILLGGDYNCFPDERLADWFPVPEHRPETVMRWLNAGTKIGLAKSLLHYYSKYYIRAGKHHDTEYAEQRFWQDQFLARQYSHDGGGEPTVGIDYDGRVFQVLGGQPGTPFGIGCWGTNTSTGYVQVKKACRKRLYDIPACILHGPGDGKQGIWDLPAKYEASKMSQKRWVELY